MEKSLKNKALKRGIIISILIALVLAVCFVFGGCFGSKVSVTGIEYTGTNGTTNVYTVTYSDGTTSTLSVENGKDGKSITLSEVFSACVEQGLYTEEQYSEFISDFIDENIQADAGKQYLYSVMNSVVTIYSAFPIEVSANVSTGFPPFGTTTQTYDCYEIYIGSGVIYKMDETYSYIITNSHVITDEDSTNSHRVPDEIMLWQYGYTPSVSYADNITINSETYHQSYDMSGGVNATIVGYSVDYDIAVLKVETADLKAKNSDSCPVTIADGYSLFDEVYAIGNSYGEGISVTKGQVSVYSEEIAIADMPADSQTHTYRVMRIDAVIYGGNSGGGVFNEFGELVGIVNAGLNEVINYGDVEIDSVPLEGFNNALPIDAVVPVVENLIYYGDETAVYSTKTITIENLGVTVGETYNNYDKTTGKLSYDVVVEKCVEGSVLENLGMQVGDVITSITIGDAVSTAENDITQTITHAYQINDLLNNVRENSMVTFRVEREGNNSISFTVSAETIKSLLEQK